MRLLLAYSSPPPPDTGSTRVTAFTLAEVLITLGIIGIVAALTMPSLIANYQEKVTVTKVKQTYSMLTQTFTYAKIENGLPKNQNFGTGMFDPNAHIAMANYFKPHLKIIEDCVGKDEDYVKNHCMTSASSDPQISSSIVLANGVTLVFRIWTPKCDWDYGIPNTCGVISALINGKKLPQSGKDSFDFYFTNNGIIPFGSPEVTDLKFEKACNPDITAPYPGYSSANMYSCTAWVIYNENMDYWKCPEKLGWDKAKSCKD